MHYFAQNRVNDVLNVKVGSTSLPVGAR